MKTFKHVDTFINVSKTGHFFLSTEKTNLNDFVYGYVNTSTGFGAGYETNYDGHLIMPTADFFKFNSLTQTENGFNVEYKVENHTTLIKENVEFMKGCNVIKQTTTATNYGDNPAYLNRLASSSVIGIGIDGSPWTCNDRFIVHYALNRMQCEGQWQSKTLKELDLIPGSTHDWEETTFRMQSLGSWSTGVYYPLFIIEDIERGETWFFEREGGEAWFMEITVRRGFTGQFLTVTLGGGDERTLWNKTLKAGESYTTTDSVYGVVKGGFEDAVRELTKYKRLTSTVSTPVIPTFNDFMNSIWCQQREDRNIALIDACAKVGIKRYVMDAGWSVTGTWVPLDKELFPTYTLKGLIDYAKQKGISFGVWFEFEKTSEEEYKLALENGVTDYVLSKNGMIVSPHSLKLNFRCKYATDRLLEKIRLLYDMGVRYIKNDHNNEDRTGISMYDGESASEGTRQNSLAYYDFIERVKKEFPDLVIEHCAAGGHRSDHGTVKRFWYQSSSDQEDYRLIPSIVQGITAYLEPEKNLIWSCPCPTNYNRHYNDLTLSSEELDALSDGRETVFNMVTSMLGFMYLSGRPDLADEINTRLISEAISVYNTISNGIKDRFPIYPCGLRNLDDRTFNALGLKGDNDTITAIWGLEQTEFTINLEKYGFTNFEVLYPTSIKNCELTLKDNVLHVKFNKPYSACLIKLK